MKFKCQCCGFEQEFMDGEEAFAAGWDAPPHFIGFVCCNLCPAVCIVLGESHEMAHAIWHREGRPKEWTFDKCAPDDAIGDQKEVEKFREFYQQMQAAIKEAKGESDVQ